MISFPSNPTNGQVYTASNNVTYTYDGTKWAGSTARTPVINPVTPKDGDILIAGSTVSIYASTAWHSVFPALYS